MNADSSNNTRLCTALLLCGLGLLTACSVQPEIQPQEASVSERMLGRFANPEITESSGLAVSRKQAGVFWTMNDSGGQAKLYAFDLAGRDLGSWPIASASNIDWEAMTQGACPQAQQGDCIFIGDTGDNPEQREYVTIYIVSEPEIQAGDSAPVQRLTAERIDFRHDQGAQDVEGMFLMPNGHLGLVSKGRQGSVHLHTLNLGAAASAPTTSRRVLTLFESVTQQTGEWVTGAALSPDGRALAVLSYANLFVFATDPATGLPLIEIAPTRCALQPLDLLQGEAVAWLPVDSEWTHLLTSEGAAGQIAGISCPSPVQ